MNEHRGRPLGRLDGRGPVEGGLVRQHHQRAGQRGDQRRAVAVGVELDVVGVVSPDDVVVGVVLGQAGVGEAVVADAAGVDQPDELGPDAPAGQEEGVAADRRRGRSGRTCGRRPRGRPSSSRNSPGWRCSPRSADGAGRRA